MHPEDELLTRFAYAGASGSERRQLTAHLKDCKVCREELRKIALLDEGLRCIASEASVPASACPHPMEWGAYAAGTLDGKEREALELHLVKCDECLRNLVLAREIVPGRAPSRALERAKVLLPAGQRSRLAAWFQAPFAVPRWAAVGVLVAAVFVATVVRLKWNNQLPPSVEVAKREAPIRPLPPIQPASPTPQLRTIPSGPGQMPAQVPTIGVGANPPATGNAPQVPIEGQPPMPATAFVPLTPTLRETIGKLALETTPKEKVRLLSELKKLVPAMPTDRVRTIQITIPALSGGRFSWIRLSWQEGKLEIAPASREEASAKR